MLSKVIHNGIDCCQNLFHYFFTFFIPQDVVVNHIKNLIRPQYLVGEEWYYMIQHEIKWDTMAQHDDTWYTTHKSAIPLTLTESLKEAHNESSKEPTV